MKETVSPGLESGSLKPRIPTTQTMTDATPATMTVTAAAAAARTPARNVEATAATAAAEQQQQQQQQQSSSCCIYREADCLYRFI